MFLESVYFAFPVSYGSKELDALIKGDLQSFDYVNESSGVLYYYGEIGTPNLEGAESYCQKHDIPYDIWYGGSTYDGVDPNMMVYRPGMEKPERYFMNCHEDYIVPVRKLRPILEDLLDEKLSRTDTFEALLNIVNTYSPYNITPLHRFNKEGN